MAFGLAWAIGFLILVSSWWVRWRRVRAILRTASPVELPINLKAVSSPAFMEPGVFGIYDPIFLLPEGITEKLTPLEFEAILLHEMSHLRRRDNLGAAIHMLVEAVFWFHPLVWFLGSRLMAERERACDEDVLRAGNQPRVYAEGVLKVCELYLQSPLRCVSGVTGSNLKTRIQEILAGHVGSDLSFSKRTALTTAGIVALAMPIAIGMARHRQLEPQLSFEVATIKPNKSASNSINMMRQPGGRFLATGVTVKLLVGFAYGFQAAALVGGPNWIDSDKWDIEGRAPTGSTEPEPEDTMPLRMRSLLEGRFQLMTHKEVRQEPVYELHIDQSGPKLQPADDAPPKHGPMPRNTIGMTKNSLRGRAISPSGLAKALSGALGRTVVDKTGLTGLYDIRFQWADDGLAQTGTTSGTERRAPADTASIFTALKEQLGLKLESAKGPVEVLVIDYVQHPSGN
jgi:uncharacterized protein (TIGR03435 family)